MRTPSPLRLPAVSSKTTGILQKETMWFIGVEVKQETSAPPPKRNPESAPVEIVDGLSTDLRCSLKRSLSLRALFGALVALYHVNDVFGVTVSVISDRPGFAGSVECV